MSHSVKIYADYGENSLDKSLYFQYAFLSIGRLVIDSLSLSRLKRSHIINWLWMVSIVANNSTDLYCFVWFDDYQPD